MAVKPAVTRANVIVGTRNVRVGGRTKIAADFSLLAAAVNLARLGVLAVRSAGSGTWTVTAG